jgi:hypothetical protein
MFGTTDTTTSAATDPGFGRTPRALAMQQQRESAKDNVDKFYMEQTVTEIMRKFANLWSKKAPANITVRMFKKEIEDLATSYPEIRDMYNENTGKLTIDTKITGSTLYDYEMVPGSTYQMDQEKQQASMEEILKILTNGMSLGPNGIIFPIIEQMKQEGKDVKIGELITRMIAGSGIQDWSKIIVDKNQIQDNGKPTPAEEAALAQDQNHFLQMIAQMQGVNSVPQAPGGGQNPFSPPPSAPSGALPPTRGTVPLPINNAIPGTPTPPPDMNNHGLPNLPQIQ